ncbi:DUF3324 domain-containing protein [Myroides guanonis]|uniref:DUF3324 domain-containing protein n=1 Tax=Myroides guanonis TaxID=1150112 RepID=A0A1I3L757_9FLAO|nr:DUF3324 domain-containing protein [Myroides guanonis]SFI80574.1 Protein of unknown function C-terminal [Myroides guanonis]
MTFKKLLFFIGLFFISVNLFASIIVTNGLTHSYKVKGGTVQKGVISIQNTADVSQNVKLYQQDYKYNTSGASFYEDYGKNERSNLKWIRLNSNLVKIDAKSKTNVSYEITVPDNIIIGSTWSVIMVEPVDDIVPTNDKRGVQLKSVIRYSIQIITTNEEAGESLLKFDAVNLNNRDGKSLLDVAVSNQGSLFHYVEVSIELFDSENGKNMGVFKSDKMSLLPTNSKLFVIDLSSMPPGSYTASILANTTEDNVFGLNIELNLSNE